MKKLSKLFSKRFERSVIGINIKQNVRIKIQQMSTYIQSNRTLLDSKDLML